jgi:nucleoside-diphosphate-sugar epimerase
MAANTLIFGGSGKVARHLTRLLAAEGHNVYSVVRKPEQQGINVPTLTLLRFHTYHSSDDVKSLGGKPVLQSIEEASVDDMVKTIQSTNASTVVWAAGAGAGNADRTKAVDQDGAIRSMDATSKAGVKRYIIISAVDVRDRENKPEPEWYHDGDRERSNKTWGAIGVCSRISMTFHSILLTIT